jgi:hypothetical protein
MVDEAAFVPIEEKHGDDCTCPPMGEIHVALVKADRACPGDRNPHRAGSITAQLDAVEPPYYPGRIVITWPAPTSNGTPLPTWPMQVHDYDTGTPMLAVTGLRIVLGGDDWGTPAILADLKMLVDVDGQPLIGDRIKPVRDPNDPERIYSKTFRCYVVEMRIWAADPTIPTRESVDRGEHTVDQYRAHHGIDGARPDLVIIDETQAARPTQ